MERLGEFKKRVLNTAAVAGVLIGSIAAGCGVNIEAPRQLNGSGGIRYDCPNPNIDRKSGVGGPIISNRLSLILTEEGQRKIIAGTSIEDTGIPILNAIVKDNSGRANLTSLAIEGLLMGRVYVLEFGDGQMITQVEFDPAQGIIESADPRAQTVKRAIRILYCNPDQVKPYIDSFGPEFQTTFP